MYLLPPEIAWPHVAFVESMAAAAVTCGLGPVLCPKWQELERVDHGIWNWEREWSMYLY